MNTKTWMNAAIAIAAALSGSAEAAPADDALNDAMQQHRGVPTRGEWRNPLMPAATGTLAATDVSGDRRLQSLVAGYSRVMLDRGGWSNPWTVENHYAGGEPLRAVTVGDGLTTRLAVVRRSEAQVVNLGIGR